MNQAAIPPSPSETAFKPIFGGDFEVREAPRVKEKMMENRRDRRDSKEKKEKRLPAPNDCSWLRWLVVLLVGWLGGNIVATPLVFLGRDDTASILGSPIASLMTVLTFVPVFIGLVLSIKFLGKTSMKDFILGVGGTINKKVCLIVLGLYAGGLAAVNLIDVSDVHFREFKWAQYLFLFVFMLLFTWVQTTTEEIMFRGVLIRWACKNNVGFTKKAVIAGLLSSLAFALVHASTPEVTSKSGVYVILALVAYFIPGMAMYVANLYFGNLMPGIIIHWINNFVCFTVITSEVTAIPVPTLFYSTAEHTAIGMILGCLCYVPLLAYIAIDAIVKRKKAASASAQ